MGMLILAAFQPDFKDIFLRSHPKSPRLTSDGTRLVNGVPKVAGRLALFYQNHLD